MTGALVALTSNEYWVLALAIATLAAVVVALLLIVLMVSVRSIERSVDGLLEVAGGVGANTANIPQLEATAPVLALIVDEAVIQDGYMNALTDGFGGTMSDTDLLIVLSVVLAAVVVLVLAVALIEVRRGLRRISAGLATLSTALQGVEAEHLRPLEGAVTAINAQFDTILGALPGIAAKAAIVAEKRPR